jgi:hypothetical protein
MQWLFQEAAINHCWWAITDETADRQENAHNRFPADRSDGNRA